MHPARRCDAEFAPGVELRRPNRDVADVSRKTGQYGRRRSFRSARNRGRSDRASGERSQLGILSKSKIGQTAVLTGDGVRN
jgi:hypothetical protein